MSSKNYRNSKIKHILITQFSPEESAMVREATTELGLRRPYFYHDAIVEKAKKILEGRGRDIANNS